MSDKVSSVAERRRTRGDGALYQRHDHATCPPLVDGDRPRHRCQGRWVGHIVVEVGGKKRRKAVYGRTQKEARIKLETEKRRRDTGTVIIGSRTVEWWMTHWLNTVAARKVKPLTLAGYRTKVNTTIVPHLGHRRLDALQPEHIRDWHDLLRREGGRKGKPLAEASVRQAHAILKKALNDAVRDRKLGVNPCDAVDAPATTTKERDRLTLEQARRALRQAGTDPRWWLALAYGMRQGEVLGLRVCDVDLDAGVLHVNQTLQMVDGEVTFGTPKTDRSRRVLPLVLEMTALLANHIGADADPDALLFTHQGEPVKPWTDSRAWHRLLADAGLPSVALHSARNSAADVLEAAGVEPRLRSQILGHSSVTMTYRYTRADVDRLRGALESSAAILALE